MDQRWRVRYLMLAPHRLGFFLAMVVVLVAAGRWPLACGPQPWAPGGCGWAAGTAACALTGDRAESRIRTWPPFP
jgi:hypothetical protein